MFLLTERLSFWNRKPQVFSSFSLKSHIEFMRFSASTLVEKVQLKFFPISFESTCTDGESHTYTVLAIQWKPSEYTVESFGKSLISDRIDMSSLVAWKTSLDLTDYMKHHHVNLTLQLELMKFTWNFENSAVVMREKLFTFFYSTIISTGKP